MLLDRGLPAIEGLDLLARLRGRGGAPRRWCSPRSATRATGSRVSTPGPRTTSASRSTSRSCWPGSGRCCAGTSSRPRVLPVLGGTFEPDEPLGAGSRTATEVALSERECDAAGRCWPAARAGSSPVRSWSTRVFEDAEEEGVVDTYVHYLRRKLGRGVVETVRGLGYRIGTVPVTRPPSYVAAARACRPACSSSACSWSSGCCCSRSTSGPPTQAAAEALRGTTANVDTAGRGPAGRARRRGDPVRTHPVRRDAGRASPTRTRSPRCAADGGARQEEVSSTAGATPCARPGSGRGSCRPCWTATRSTSSAAGS